MCLIMLVMYNYEEVYVEKQKDIQKWRQNDVYKEVGRSNYSYCTLDK